jgi:arylsulfatase A-like enzyme
MKKNILLIFTDQQRFDTIAAAGNPHIKTPNLDRLCREGTRFSAAYTPSPVCVPARCSMHYGQYPMHTGCFENNYDMPDDRPSVADALAAAGYRTHAIGKRHFTPDPQALRGFQTLERQEEIVDDASQDDYLQYLEANDCGYAVEPYGVRGEAYYVPQLSNLPPKHHPTQWTADRTVEFLKTRNWKPETGKLKSIGNQQSEIGNADQPFFLMSSFIHPHPPFSPPTPWHKLYRGPDMPLPKMTEDNESLYLYTNRIQNRYKGRDAGRDIRLHQLIKSYYWASISFIDFQIGRILQTLEKTGQLDNTLIIFAADHGDFLGDYNCFGKRSFMDSCARVPLICRLPGTFDAGAVCDTPVSLIDIMPTALAAAGNCVEHLDGEDLAKIADGSSGREAVFGHYQGAHAGIYMAVSKEWKYIWSAADNKELLFDRIKDSDEMRNRAYNVACGAAVRKMRKILQDHIRTMPGHENVVNADGWIVKEPVTLPNDPDAGLIVQDPPCFHDRLFISGYSTEGIAGEDETGADFDPLKK